MTPEDLAKLFHDTYEALAPSFGYETHVETRVFVPTTPNGQLMTAAAEIVLKCLSEGMCRPCRDRLGFK